MIQEEPKGPIIIEVFFPDKGIIGNNRPSLIINHPFMLQSFIHALARGIPDFEGKEFRLIIKQDDLHLASGTYLITNSNLKIIRQTGHDDQSKTLFQRTFSECVNSDEFSMFVSRRRREERLRGLVPLEGYRNHNEPNAQPVIDSVVQSMLNDPEMANRIINSYMEQLQKQYRADWEQ